jgi:hypothetical protein
LAEEVFSLTKINWNSTQMNQRLPEEVPPYTEDTIFEALNVVRRSRLKLSDKDKMALVSEVGKRIGDLKRAAPQQLFQLHRDIELVNLDVLIARFKMLLASADKAEKRWQKLFDLNPFILTMIFGYPVVAVLREAGVGLPLLGGSGAKIADFLAKNPTTDNAALIELKTPQSDLLAPRPYRGTEKANPVYPPHVDLSGAVAQVLDQRHRLQKDIATHLSNNRGLTLTTYHVDCVVVVGRLPDDEDRKRSFELYRQGLKDVRVVTFDELLYANCWLPHRRRRRLPRTARMRKCSRRKRRRTSGWALPAGAPHASRWMATETMSSIWPMCSNRRSRFKTETCPVSANAKLVVYEIQLIELL